MSDQEPRTHADLGSGEEPTVPPPLDAEATIKQDHVAVPLAGGAEATVFEPPPSGQDHDPNATLLESQAAVGAPPSTRGGSRSNLPSAQLGSNPSGLRSSRLAAQGAGDLRVGEIYAGKYELEHEIARGGMGVVYKARQIDLNRVVALKVMLSGGYAGAEERRRFILEAEASARLKHPNIVPVYDIGEVDGNLYFTMDYVEGAPLSKRKDELDRPALLKVMIQVADGMGYAHQRGIIHRDLKPANVMLDEQDVPLIMDFGLAKQVEVVDAEGQPSLRTREGAVMGTPHYMPPEQADGRISDIDVRSDVYALGVILYQLWTGQLPFQAKSLTELMLKIYETDPRPPRDLDPTIDWDLEAVILKAMEKSKDKRYQTAHELMKDLENVRDGLPVSARRATIVYRARKWVRRKRVSLAVAGAFLLLASAGGAAYAHKASEAEREERRRFSEAMSAGAGESEALAAEVDAFAQRLQAFEAEAAEPEERRARASRSLRALEALGERARRAQAQLGPFRDRAAAGDLERTLGARGARIEELGKRLRRLISVHAKLDAADEAGAEAKELASVARTALQAGRGGPATVEWSDLLEAVAEADVGLSEGEGADAALAREPLRAFRASTERVSQLLFTALGLTGEDAWPEVERAKARLRALEELRAGVETARQEAANVRLAALSLARGQRVLELLREFAKTAWDDEARMLRLRAARTAQALVQRGREAHAATPGLDAASFAANRAYAEALLATKAYLVFDAELLAAGAFAKDDLEALRAAKARAVAATENLRDELEGIGAKIKAAPDAALLAQLVRRLRDLGSHPGLDTELQALRRDLSGRARSALESLQRVRAERELNQAVTAAREREAKAGGDPSQVDEVAEAWAAARRLYTKRGATLGKAATRAGAALCARAEARVYFESASTLERQDPPRSLELAKRAAKRFAPLKAVDPDAAAKLSLVEALVERLERVQRKPEGMVLVAGREDVELGSGARDRNPARRVSIRPFYLAKREVTNRDYAAFVASPEYSRDAFWKALGVERGRVLPYPSGWSSPQPPEGLEDLPVSGISWHEARGYARFAGMRLPTDREWEFAARYAGGRVSEFPWGPTFEQGALAHELRPVGINPNDVTAAGVFDMGGNVSEWVTRTEDDDPAPSPSARGASFLYPSPRIARGVHRLTPRADYRGPQLGVRLAKGSQ